jgi:zinc finger SWIM domain-containing protein 3
MAELDKGTPQVGLRFKNSDEAWQFLVAYGGRSDFDVRKRHTNYSKFDRKITSCRYICANEGHRRKVERVNVAKCFRPETRTDCKTRMTITLDRGEGLMLSLNTITSFTCLKLDT